MTTTNTNRKALAETLRSYIPTKPELRVLQALYDLSVEKREMFHNPESIAERIGVSATTARRHLRAMSASIEAGAYLVARGRAKDRFAVSPWAVDALGKTADEARTDGGRL